MTLSAIEFGRKESFTKINEVFWIRIYSVGLLRGGKGRCSPICSTACEFIESYHLKLRLNSVCMDTLKDCQKLQK